MDDAVRLDRRRIPVGGRRLLVAAPEGDPFLAAYRRGGALSDFSELCRRCLRPDDVMLDVGANIGLTALVAAHHLPAGRIVAVEASLRNCAALRENLRHHGLDRRVEVISCAAGATSGSVPFFENSAYGHIISDAHFEPYPSLEMPMTTIDDLVVRAGLDRLDFVKLDIEGYEQDALEGARETLARFDPIVALEFNSWCLIAYFDRSPRRLLEWLLARFPQLYVWRKRKLVDVRAMTPAVFLQDHLTSHRCVTDLVACGATKCLETTAARLAPRWRFRTSGRD